MNIMYPTRLIETSTHGNAVSHLIKTLDKKPAPPKCIPVGISTISTYGLLMDGDTSEVMTFKFRINDGPIEEIIMSPEGLGESEEEMIANLEKMMDFMYGVSENIAVYPNVVLLQKFCPPDQSWAMGTPAQVGGLSEDGTLNLLGHDVNVEDTVAIIPNEVTQEITCFKVDKAIRNLHKVEIFPSLSGDGYRSYFDILLDSEFYKHQKSKESQWTEVDSIVTLSCGGLPMTPFVPSKMSDVESGFVQFEIYGKSDEYDHYELINEMTFKVDGVSYSFNEVVYSDSGIPVNDGMLTITELDGSYLISVCCTNNRTPVNVVFDDPMLVFEVPSTGPESIMYPNWASPSDGSLEAVLTPPAIAPFEANYKIGLHVPNRGIGELWGVVSINDVSYGRVKLCNGSSETTFVVNGHSFYTYYREDYNMVITLGGRFGEIPVGQNVYTYYKIEIEFDTDPMYLKPTGVWYQTRGWNNPLSYDKNPTTSLDMRTNKLTAFMKYAEYRPM